jgi:hypothetical protein
MKSMKRCTRILLLLLLVFPLLAQVAKAEDWVYRLHKGENLTLVAQRFLKPEFTPEQLQIDNGILKDREMPVGTEIRVPLDWRVSLPATFMSWRGSSSRRRTRPYRGRISRRLYSVAGGLVYAGSQSMAPGGIA